MILQLLETARMVAFMVLHELLSHLADPLLALLLRQGMLGLSIDDLLGAVEKALVVPVFAAAVFPWDAAEVAELPTAAAAESRQRMFLGPVGNLRHMIASNA
jgi:predicted Na+-dependent transporter